MDPRREAIFNYVYITERFGSEVVAARHELRSPTPRKFQLTCMYQVAVEKQGK